MSCSRILVVDDEADFEELIKQKFRRQIKAGEMNFTFACDGVDALSKLDSDSEIEIVFSDINMPRMDGLTLLGKIQTREFIPTTVMVTAYSDQKNIRKAMNNGAFDFITKPIDFDDFDATIEKAIRHTKMVKSLESERSAAERSEAQLRRYFSPSIARAVSKDTNALAATDERRTATYLFTDLANFSPLVENTQPKIIVDLLNRYFDEMIKIVFEFDGTLMKIIGDAIHVTFGAPEHDPEHARKAVACALKLDEYAQSISKEMMSKGIMLGATRIGINTGEAIIGSFGGENFFDYTAYGTAVNIAARLENANKTFGTRICVSQHTSNLIEDFVGRPIGNLTLRGNSQSLTAFEPLTKETAAASATNLYIEAYEMLANSDPEAKQCFAKLVGSDAEDPLAAFHLSRILSGANDVKISV